MAIFNSYVKLPEVLSLSLLSSSVPLVYIVFRLFTYTCSFMSITVLTIALRDRSLIRLMTLIHYSIPHTNSWENINIYTIYTILETRFYPRLGISTWLWVKTLVPYSTIAGE